MTYKFIDPILISRSMLENKEMIRQFVEMYLFQSPLDFQALEDSIAAGEMPQIKDDAHHIKPTMAYIGALSLKDAFQELENKAQVGDDITAIRTRFEELKPDFEATMEELKLLIKT